MILNPHTSYLYPSLPHLVEMHFCKNARGPLQGGEAQKYRDYPSQNLAKVLLKLTNIIVARLQF